ncbi:helix-turn-helix transcriptional regulator [Oceanispirochaeta sp.]|jgi:transcriptional regulator with XRE-family HTH domain|uniref:helix-turn-helix domain-containing protein n=1 Tax=Oceanispirochaeta sp. TaxID=2035350 RepID=UPI002619B10F|nr:helix-turn-helix transcriptional regulator [Oceanispirochaeta sp.]MDA3957566.1 helix-turn-helix transcriptional regulator [Oceanispirochaeta sp.]
MKGNDVVGFLDKITKSDPKLESFEKEYGPLANFLEDLDILIGREGISQKDLAKKARTTQSAVSRFENMKIKPGYVFLNKISNSANGELFISPMGKYSVTIPYDLQEKADLIAETIDIPVKKMISNWLRAELEKHYLMIEKEEVQYCEIIDFPTEKAVKISGTKTTWEDLKEN